MLLGTIRGFFKSGHERSLLAKKNIIQSFLIKGGSIFLSLVIVPITINYVNPAQYGIWLTLSSFIIWFTFFDVGLGNGLKNKLAEQNALGQYLNARIYVSTTYALMAIIAIIFFVLFLIISQFLVWEKILNVPFDVKTNFSNIVLILFSIFCIQFIIQTINTVLIASHAPAKSSLINLIGQFVGVVIIYILTKATTQGKLLYLVLVLAGVPLLIQFVASIWLYKTTYKNLAPSLKLVNFKHAKNLLGLGGIFFIIQIAAMVLYQTDNIIITQIYGPAEVTTFNICYKLFSVMLMVNSIIMTPFWSAFTDAYAKNDLDWIKRTINKMRKIFLLLTGSSVLLLIGSPLFFKLWLGNKVSVPFSLSLSMVFYVSAISWHTLHVYFLNGIGKIRLQLFLIVFVAVINVPVAIFLAKNLGMGLAGITLSNVIGFALMGIMLSIQTEKMLNNTATGIWKR